MPGAQAEPTWGLRQLDAHAVRIGTATTQIGSETFACQRLFNRHGVEVLYILNFYLPRFQDLKAHDKLVTVCHELWHISPRFDGDFRRFEGRCYLHSPREAEFDRQAEAIAADWIARHPDVYRFEFLAMNFTALQRAFGRVVGTRIQHPRLLPT